MSEFGSPSDHALILDPKRIPLSLYIHVPWCIKKCPYCDFNSHALPTDKGQPVPFTEYVDALIKDINAQLPYIQGRPLHSIFIGGGTPSLLPTAEFARLFQHLKNVLDFEPDIEITLEANPATLEHAPFEEYLSLGINRLSVGVQSFDNQALSVLGRVHDCDDAVRAILQARQAGFTRVNADLMHGLPMQTPELAVNDLKTALQAGATHVSWYQLTIEPNTAFYRTPPDLPDDETLEMIETQGREVLTQAGFDNYEISAWVGRDDTPCRHNLNYWRFGDYLAIGAGAHGKVTLLDHPSHPNGIYRFAKSRLPKDYLTYDNAPKMVDFHRIDEVDLPFEFMMNVLRLAKGVDVATFEERTGLLISTIDNELLPLQHQGFMVFDPNLIAPTKMGFRYANHLMQAFLP